MNEQHSFEKQEQESPALDDRLSAYYGPALGEQPLPPSAWQGVYSQLGSQSSPRRQLRRSRRNRWHLRRSSAPSFIESAFTHIIDEAHLSLTSSMLACSIQAQVRQPQVRVMPLGKQNIRLRLPVMTAFSLESAELDVLLATGLSRYLCMRRPSYALKRLLLYSVIPLLWLILLMLWLHDILHFTFPIAIGICVILCSVDLWLLHRQGRHMTLQADRLMVLWLGRGRACRGLHQLAERSSSPLRRKWSELSLAERIGYVCGSSVPVEHERLTLAR